MFSAEQRLLDCEHKDDSDQECRHFHPIVKVVITLRRHAREHKKARDQQDDERNLEPLMRAVRDDLGRDIAHSEWRRTGKIEAAARCRSLGHRCLHLPEGHCID